GRLVNTVQAGERHGRTGDAPDADGTNSGILLAADTIEEIGGNNSEGRAREEAAAGGGAHEVRQVTAFVQIGARLRVIDIRQKVVRVDAGFGEVVFELHRMDAGGLDIVEETLWNGIAFRVDGVVLVDRARAPLAIIGCVVIVRVVSALRELNVGIGERRLRLRSRAAGGQIEP